MNIAEGNGKRLVVDRARFLDIARGSALESAACVDVVVACRQLEPVAIGPGKASLIRGAEHEYEHEYEYERAN